MNKTGIITLILSLGACIAASAHPTDNYYADLLKSKTYTLRLRIENKTILDSFSSRYYKTSTVVENRNVSTEGIDVIISNPSVKKQYQHLRFVKKPMAIFRGSDEGKTLEEVQRVGVSPAFRYDQFKNRELVEAYKIRKANLLRLLGPIYVKTGWEPGFTVSYLNKGTMNIQGTSYYYEEYQVDSEPGTSLRLLYLNNQLKRVLKIITRKDDSDFLLGVSREKNSFENVIVEEFSEKINDEVLKD